jgi:hypothetical protein
LSGKLEFWIVEVMGSNQPLCIALAGVRLGSYNPSPDLTLCGSFYALGLSFVLRNWDAFVAMPVVVIKREDIKFV